LDFRRCHRNDHKKGTTPTTFKKSNFKIQVTTSVKAESITDDRSMDSLDLLIFDEETNQLFKRSILASKKRPAYTIAGTIGRYAMVNESLLPANTNQAVAIIRP
jgi:type I restriction enzyme S subunit